jgi:hypothetical protein
MLVMALDGTYHNNLMQLGGSLGNSKNWKKKTCYKNSIYFVIKQTV